jgi:hypothetical protein
VPLDESHRAQGNLEGQIVFNIVTPMQWLQRQSGDLGPSTVTGSAAVLLQQDGLGSFQGTVHESGAIGHNYLFAVAFLDVVDANGKALAFAQSGHVGGQIDLTGPTTDNFKYDGPKDRNVQELIYDKWNAVVNSRTEFRLHVSTDPLSVVEFGVFGLFAELIARLGIAAITGVALFLGNPKVHCHAWGPRPTPPDGVDVGTTCYEDPE